MLTVVVVVSNPVPHGNFMMVLDTLPKMETASFDHLKGVREKVQWGKGGKET